MHLATDGTLIRSVERPPTEDPDAIIRAEITGNCAAGGHQWHFFEHSQDGGVQYTVHRCRRCGAEQRVSMGEVEKRNTATGKATERTCPVCGRVFTPDRKHGHAIYDLLECKAEARRRLYRRRRRSAFCEGRS